MAVISGSHFWMLFGFPALGWHAVLSWHARWRWGCLRSVTLACRVPNTRDMRLCLRWNSSPFLMLITTFLQEDQGHRRPCYRAMLSMLVYHPVSSNSSDVSQCQALSSIDKGSNVKYQELPGNGLYAILHLSEVVTGKAIKLNQCQCNILKM